MKSKPVLPILLLIMAALACGLPLSAPAPTLTATEQIIPTSPAISSPTAPASEPVPNNIPEESDLIRQGAARSLLEPYNIDEIALGDFDEESTSCGADYLAGTPAEDGQILLRLGYWQALRPEGLELFIGPQPDGIEYIEVLNSTNGLGMLIYEDGQPITRQALEIGPCQQLLKIPFQTDFEIDTVFISFKNPQAVWQLASVEMLGRVQAFSDPPVFWRVPLDGYPAGLAVNETGLVYVITDPDGFANYADPARDSLYSYDVEGNQLKKFSIPNGSNLVDVNADPFGNLVVIDSTYGWFISLSPEGEQLSAGGEDLTGQVAVSPLDGNVYILTGSAIRVYASDTGEFLREMPLNDIHSHIRLAFDPQGHLYTLRDHDWAAELLQLDPLTGQEINLIPLERSSTVDILASDIAIDGSGNFYILFIMNDGNIAVHVLDPQGSLLRRLGKLTYDPVDRPEGTFFEPRKIAVTPDGRFLLITDGIDGNFSLTAYLLEPEP
jgi:outer membrane protein assembly factor BamB